MDAIQWIVIFEFRNSKLEPCALPVAVAFMVIPVNVLHFDNLLSYHNEYLTRNRNIT